MGKALALSGVVMGLPCRLSDRLARGMENEKQGRTDAVPTARYTLPRAVINIAFPWGGC